MGGYDVAQICPNGHVANAHVKTMPEFNQTYCQECGEKTLGACPACAKPIRGSYLESFGSFEPPAFCIYCGKSFPWTSQRIEAAIQFSLNDEQLNTAEKEDFKQSVGDIVKNTPKAQAAAGRLKRLLLKASKETAGAVRDILVDVASETAKKIIWPNG